jgi:hypothetical protein
MRQLSLFLRFLSLILIASLPLLAADKTTDTSSSTISGRVLDAATRKPIPGSVVVALESQPAGAIVNATSPNSDGSFSFTAVAPGNYAIVVTGQNASKKSYTPVLVVGKGLAPGANLGTIALKSTGSAAKTVSVPVESNTPITVTLAVNQKVDQYSFSLPWADGVPTFDTATKNCSNGTACGNFTLDLPASGMLMANFDGKSLQYLPKTLAAKYSVSATAYTQNGAKPTCESRTSAPYELSSAGTAKSIVFTGCE